MGWEFYVEGQRRAQKAVRALFYLTSESGELPTLVTLTAIQAEVKAEEIAPHYTGTLAAAHRLRRTSSVVAEIYIDPSVENLLLGGRPAFYGPIVHRKGYPYNWMERTVKEFGPRAVAYAAKRWWAMRRSQ